VLKGRWSHHSTVRVLFCGAVLAVVLLLAGWGSTPAEDLKAPDFTAEDLDGNNVTLSKILESGPVVISFWATWCKPCVRELPHLQEIYDKYKDRGFSVLAISVDSPRSLSKVKSFVKGHNYTVNVLLDPNKDISRQFNAHLFPYTFVINTNSEIVYKNYGYRPGDEKKVERQLLLLLEGENPPAEQSDDGAEIE
jgi:cytochrome c biogenesis protein CcmG/thiol:disulfide interchange protein DsbE